MTETATSTETIEAIHSATYCPEDNKLRLYPAERLDSETFQRVKQAGFKWAPKQEIFVAPAWTPSREDLLLELCGEIGDEDYSPEERAADRAERFAGYRDKRRAEAHGSADRFDAGPACFGHQNAARAERQARRHDRHRSYAVSQWSKAEYWQTRTAAVIGHALYKSSAKVRRGRLLRLEAEQRKTAKSYKEATNKYKLWQKIAAETDAEKAHRWANALAGYGYGYDYQHPRNPERSDCLWSLLNDEQDPITGQEAAALYLERFKDPSREGSSYRRQLAHLENRLAYEKAMLDAEGGMVADNDMIPGGFLGGFQIQKVNKSPATGRVVSVVVTADNGKQKRINVERFADGIYRAPTDEELSTFKAQQKAKPKAAGLINPTPEDAQRLQSIWNATAKSPSDVIEMTQAEYTSRTKHSDFWGTSEVSADARCLSRWDEKQETAACKVRRGLGSGFTAAYRVVVITDKPQKPLAIDWEAAEARIAEKQTANV